MFLTLWILGIIVSNLYQGGSFTVAPVKDDFIVTITPPHMNPFYTATYNPADFTLYYTITLTQYEDNKWKSFDRVTTNATHITLPNKGDWASIIISMQATSPMGIKSNEYIISSQQIKSLYGNSNWPYLSGQGH